VPHHRRRIHAQPHMIESHRLDKSDVVVRDPGGKMFFGISLGIVNLREPLAQVDPAPQMGRALMGERGVGLGKRDGGKDDNEPERWLHGRLAYLPVPLCPLWLEASVTEGTQEPRA